MSVLKGLDATGEANATAGFIWHEVGSLEIGGKPQRPLSAFWPRLNGDD
jgi:hypothetical protein